MNRKWVQTKGIYLVLLISFYLRLIQLGVRGIWYDDAFSILLARQDLPKLILGTAADTMPPLYYLILHLWMYLGDGIFLLRFLSVILSMLAVAGVYALARCLFGESAALLAAIFTGLAPFQIYHAQELRMYSLLALALLGYAAAFVSFMRSEKVRRTNAKALVFVAIFGALALYSHNLAFATLAVPDIYLLLKRSLKSLSKLLLAQGGSLLLFIPWLLYVPGQVEKVQRAFWTPRPGLAELLQLLLAFTTNLPLPGWFLPIALFMTLSIAVVAVLIVRVQGGKRQEDWALVLLLAIVPPLLLFVLSYLLRPIFVPRGVILSSMMCYLLLGWVLSKASERAQATVLVVVALWLVVPLQFQYNYDEFPRSPFKEAADFLIRNAARNDLVLHDNKLAYFPMRYYEPNLRQTFLPDPPGSDNDTLAQGTMDALSISPTALDQVDTKKGRIWFVIFQTALDEAKESGRPAGNKAWLDARFQLASLTRFNDLNVYLYEK